MKKIFTLIGILTAIFSIYLMLLIADKSGYISESRAADFSLDKKINLEILEKYAKESDVSVQIRTINNYAFGNIDCEIEVLNPSNNLVDGVQKSLFPNQRIKIVTGKPLKDRTVRYFMVQEDDANKISTFQNKLAEAGINSYIAYKEPIRFNVGMLFSSLNIGFFVSIFCLSLFCIVIYYISRSKEIGILKLNGWSESRISLRLFKSLLINTAYGFLSLATAFSIYIIIRDIKQLTQYLFMILLLFLSLNIVYICVAVIAVIFIKNADFIHSIKNKKNNKLIYILLMVFKVGLVVVVFVIATKLIDNTIRLNDGIKRANEINAYNWYMLTEHISLSEKERKEVELFMNKFDDSQIYNYASSDLKLEKNEKKVIYDDMDSIESNMLIISQNMLPILGVKDKDGKKPDLDSEKSYILVPENLWAKRQEIIDYEGLEEVEAVCIADEQWLVDFSVPGKYSYNSVVLVTDLKKTPSLGYGEVLMTETVAKKLENKLKKMGYERSDIELEPLRTEILVFISNYQTDLFESVMYTFIILLTYLLVDITLYSVYYEFKKKKMAVLNLFGKNAMEDISSFPIYNATIVVIASLVVNRIFIFLVLPETIMFYLLLKQKSFKNIGTVIKGR